MAKSLGKVAKRYASALFASCSAEQLDNVNTALTEFSLLWEENSELRDSLLNPLNPVAQRRAALREVALQICPKLESFAVFLVLLLENRRLATVSQIAAVFNQLVEQFQGILTLEVTSAFPLAKTEAAEMEVQIVKAVGRSAVIKWQVNPELIGGLVIKSGDRILDGSILHMLEKARDTLRI